MSNKLSRRPRRGRKHSGPLYIQLFRYVLNCPGYLSLSLAARAALIEVNNAYNGSNNGKIVLSERQFAGRMGCDRQTVRKALHELIEKGFIEPRIKGAFSVKFRRATEWRLNDRRCDVTGEPMSQAFLKWSSPEPERRVPNETETSPWEKLGMSRASWYRHGKPAETETISRDEISPPYGVRFSPTSNFPETPPRGEIFPHCETIHGGKISPTSISTRAMAPKSASVEPFETSKPDGPGSEPPAHAPIGHNAGPPLQPDAVGPGHSEPDTRLVWTTPVLIEADYTPELRELYKQTAPIVVPAPNDDTPIGHNAGPPLEDGLDIPTFLRRGALH
jgi:hypothetical protein